MRTNKIETAVPSSKVEEVVINREQKTLFVFTNQYKYTYHDEDLRELDATYDAILETIKSGDILVFSDKCGKLKI